MAPPSEQADPPGGARDLKSRASARLGTWIKGKWMLDSLLGVGGMAAVYAATHRNGSRAALKVLHREFAAEESVRERFLREGYVANKVNHPGRVAILDDDVTEEGEPFLVMELLEGETLQERWKRANRKLPVVEALVMAEQVLDTLQPFHEMRVIHRDLKPANIFITNEGRSMILDFGVAQLREAGGQALTRAGTALGTPSYMSPEQAMGKSDTLDGRSDVFSMGATLYAVLSGKRLHHGKSDNEAFILAATQPPPSIARTAPDLPPEVIALCDKALQWDRRKRFQSASEMRDACRELTARLGGAGGPRPPPPPRPPGPSSAGPLTPLSSVSGDYTPLSAASSQSVHTPGAFSPQSAMSAMSAMSAGALTPGAMGPSTGGYAPGTYPGGSPSGMRTPPPSRGPMPAPARAPGPAPRPPAPPPRPPQAARVPPSTRGAALPGAGGHAPPTPAQLQAVPQAAPAQRQPAMRAPVAAPSRPAIPLPPEQSGEDVHKLLAICAAFEQVAALLRSHGDDHAETLRAMGTVFRAAQDALRARPDAVWWSITPFCFAHGPTSVWEPAPPLDGIPWALASAGLSDVRLAAGVSEDEVRELCRVLLGEHEDLVARVEEARFVHVHCRFREEWTDADAIEQERFSREAAELTQVAGGELGAVAAQAHDAQARASFALDAATHSALTAQLSLDGGQWRQRFFDVCLDAYAVAAARGETDQLRAPLAGFGSDLCRRGRYQEIFGAHELLLERMAAHPALRENVELARAITHALFAPASLRQLFLAGAGQVGALPAELQRTLHEGLRLVVPWLDGNYLEPLLLVASELDDGELRQLALGGVDQALAGHELEALERLESLPTDLALAVLDRVVASGNREALAALQGLLQSSIPVLRCEATAFLARDPVQLAKQLLELMDAGDAGQRNAALATLVRHQVKAAGPALVRLLEDESFGRRPRDEQVRLFEALYVLNAARAESLLTATVDKHGLMADDRLDQVRAMAASLLGHYGSSEEALNALVGAARRRPWNSAALRGVAASAAEALAQRMGRNVSLSEAEA